MAKVIGSIDNRGRPLVRIDAGDDGLLAIVDSGFNGAMIVAGPSVSLFDRQPGGVAVSVELGNGTTAKFVETIGTINWLGTKQRIGILVSESWTPAVDEPSALIGTRLLTPHLLLIDFDRGLVEIETQ